MKCLSTILFLLILTQFQGQIGLDIKPGKYNKKYQVIDRGEQYYSGLIKKPLKGTELQVPWQYNPSIDNGLDYHYSTSIPGDTTGISYHGEYINYQPFPQRKPKILPETYIALDPVSNKEWNQFQAYIADSIARRILGEEYPNEFLIPFYDEELEEKSYEEWYINWKTKSNYWWKPDYSPLLNMMYYPEAERYYNIKELDSRKLFFNYYWLHQPLNDSNAPSSIRDANDPKYVVFERIATFRDSTLWKRQDSDSWVGNMYDNMVSYYQSNEQFENEPVLGVNTPQTKAFLEWKRQMHQKVLDRKKIPLYVEYYLPDSREIKQANPQQYSYSVPEFDLSPWQISNKDYEEYIHYVRDSVARRILGEEYPDEFLIPTYGDELYERDPEVWALNWGTKLKWEKLPLEYREQLANLFTDHDSGFEHNIDPRKLIYHQFYYDYEEACKMDTSFYLENDQVRHSSVKWQNRTEGKGLFLGFTNQLGMNSDVRSDINRSHFIIGEKINIYPGIICSVNPKCCDEKDTKEECFCDECNFDHLPKVYDFKTNPESAVTGLRYTQARSYYLWKIRHEGKVVKHDNVLMANYIPSEEEWKALQEGKKVIHPKEELEAPTPTFRYVVKFFPKKL